ncbi:nucleotidyltransferase domain-containing protein [Parabacteroides sp. PF5-6]|uniref:nucleotidyltransferase domain-containing protein n=1 Tax=Parabacteroides sp. PF5-6 TaxID=1742403 RepID=UPI0024073387|nr:nucleotidyltransferase domain-containing protein [Parabacteroides sp. PF5-6]MDF9831226.1 putative nucleotidyltransferase [Parabacteroides sp. PF5-6]
MKRSEIVQTVRKIIRRTAPDATIILYGSEARGEARANSDIDLLILLNKDKLSILDKDEIRYPIYELELETGVHVSPLIYTQKEWANRPFKTPFYINVMKEGIML